MDQISRKESNRLTPEERRAKDRQRKQRERLDPRIREYEALSSAVRRQTDESKARDRERKRLARQDENYREKERERERGRVRNRQKKPKPDPLADDWVLFDWENLYIEKRDHIEAYRQWLQLLHKTDLEKHVKRYLVYESTPLEIDIRAKMPRVWQTTKSATIQIPGIPLIKRFKVLDPNEKNPIPIGEGELVRKYLASFKTRGRKFLFPKSKYDTVTNAPIFFVPLADADLLQLDCEYIDISRCYSQLLSKLPSLIIDFNYGRRVFEAMNYPPHDMDLLQSKHWGRAMVGTMRQRYGKCFVYGEKQIFPSTFYHGDTSNWVHAILHYLASYAIRECGCFRWHTDGGFFARNGGYKFGRMLDNLGLDYTLDSFAAVMFASLDQYQAVGWDGHEKRTALYSVTPVSDFIFMPVEEGGSQRDNVIHGLNSWLLSTLEREKAA